MRRSPGDSMGRHLGSRGPSSRPISTGIRPASSCSAVSHPFGRPCRSRISVGAHPYYPPQSYRYVSSSDPAGVRHLARCARGSAVPRRARNLKPPRSCRPAPSLFDEPSALPPSTGTTCPLQTMQQVIPITPALIAPKGNPSGSYAPVCSFRDRNVVGRGNLGAQHDSGPRALGKGRCRRSPGNLSGLLRRAARIHQRRYVL